ncbi:hypothetical protein [Streptomyces niveus]|uniref:hypothetical protein n=1 Tax=Streptomyces niveus TaxID=193462 RepID=UPI00340925E9
MPATFDEHVNEALALIAPARGEARRRPQPTRIQQGARPHLALVRRPISQGVERR